MRTVLFVIIALSFLWNNPGSCEEKISDIGKSWEQKTISFYADTDSPGMQALKGEPVEDTNAWGGKCLKFRNETLQWGMTYPWKKTDFQSWTPYPWKLFTLYARIKVKHAVGSPEGIAFACGVFGPGREGRIEKMVMAADTKDMEWNIYEIARFLPNDQSFYIAQEDNPRNISEIYLDCIFFVEGKTTGALWFSQGPTHAISFDSKWMSETGGWPVTDIGKQERADIPAFGISCFRKGLEIPADWENAGYMILKIPELNCQVYWNGAIVQKSPDGNYCLPEKETNFGKKNILALKVYHSAKKDIFETENDIQLSLVTSVNKAPAWVEDGKVILSSGDGYKYFFRLEKNRAEIRGLVKAEVAPVDKNGKVNPFLLLRLSVNGAFFPMQFDSENSCYTTWLFSESVGEYPVSLYQRNEVISGLGTVSFTKSKIPAAPEFFPTGVFYCAGYLYKFSKEEKGWEPQLRKVFKDMKEHGIDTIVTADFNPEKIERDRNAMSLILDTVGNENMKVIIFEGQRLDRSMGLRPIDLYDMFQKERGGRKASKNILACQIWDEINMPDAENWHFIKGIYEGINPEIPVYCWLNKSDSRFIEKMRPSIYSRDTYMFHPSTGEGEWTGEFEKFLDYDSAYADRQKVPFWIALAAFGPWGKNSIYRMPTPNEMVLQNWMSIAAGAKGLFYFTYFIDSPVHKALVNGKDEKPIESYEALGKFLNEISPLKPLLLKLKTAPAAATCEDPDIMLRMRCGESGNKYLFIVNKNVEGIKNPSIRLMNDIQGMSLVDMITGEEKKLANGGVMSCTIDPGRGKIYMLKNKEGKGL